MGQVRPIEVPKGLRSEIVDAAPRPSDLFRGYARGGYRIADAIAEYVDNSVEQASSKEARKPATVTVDFPVDGATFHVIIKDNCGGCPRANARVFIQPGGTGTSSDAAGISRFGMGGKTAGLSVAKSVRIFSRHQSDSGFLAILDKTELERKNEWTFPIYDLPAAAHLEPGATQVDLVGVSSDAHAGQERLRLGFGARYALLLREPNAPRILVGGLPVPLVDPLECLLTGVEVPSQCQPAVTQTSEYYQSPGESAERSGVSFSISVGLGPSGSTTPEKGARVYCNGRRVGPVTQLGMSADLDDSLHTTSDLTWLRGVVSLRGRVELLPWTNRKDQLDPQAPSYRDLERKLHAAYDDFLDDRVAEARRALRERRGRVGRLPSISDLLEDHWRTQISRQVIDVNKVRTLLRDAPAFRKAQREDSDDEIPGPPDKKGRGLVPLHAEVDASLVQEAKDLISRLSGKSDIANTDVVRTTLEHFLECDVVRQRLEGNEGEHS